LTIEGLPEYISLNTLRQLLLYMLFLSSRPSYVYNSTFLSQSFPPLNEIVHFLFPKGTVGIAPVQVPNLSANVSSLYLVSREVT
jgi:hypothetical protein